MSNTHPSDSGYRGSCKRNHPWKPETTRWKPKTLGSGKVTEYRECRLCVIELKSGDSIRAANGTANRSAKAANKAAALCVAKMAVVTDDWSECLDCPSCHAPLTTDEDDDLRCLFGHSPRAYVQAVMV